MIDAAVQRSAWYSYNPEYLAYLERVVAHVDAHYATLPRREARVVVGTSAGGRAALYAALERPELFGGAGLLSPALGNSLYYYQPYLSGAKGIAPNLRVWLSAGTYEGSLCEDARVLERYFRREAVVLEVAYTHEGHSFGTWRAAAAGALVHLLPN
jgi:enterochelin esterase-like enzyme